MTSRYLINLTLLLIIVILYGFLYWWPHEEQKQYATLLPDLTAVQVTDIVIKRPSQSPVHLHKDGHWQLRQPLQARANAARINLILDILSQPVLRTFKAPADITRFGLNPPQLTLYLNQFPLQFGMQEPLSQSRYIQYRNTIYLLADNVMPMLKASAASFIDNRLLDPSLHIEKIAFPPRYPQQPGIVMQLQNGHWHSNDADLSSDDILLLVEKWQHAYAIQVDIADTDLLAKPRADRQISLYFQEQKQPLVLIEQATDHALLLVNTATGLRYRFPVQMKQQLFPRHGDK